WVLDADIRGFFDIIDHVLMCKFLEHRIADRRILRLIQQWLRAGVFEDGQWTKTEVGTPQGAVASPLLANVYLHYVFDLWVQQWRTRYATGEVIVVRYADDCAPRKREEDDFQDRPGTLSRVRDEGRSLGIGLQDQISNHPKLHGLRVLVMSVREKAGHEPV